MNDVTLPPIRYIFRCLVCDGIGASDRKDKFTCSPRCRVRLHRDADKRDFVEFVRNDIGVAPGYYARSMAAKALCPSLSFDDLDEIKAAVWSAAIKLAQQEDRDGE